MIRPIGPDVPAGLQPLLTEIRDAVNELITPTYPKPMFACVEADLPPAADFTNCSAMVTDAGIPVISDGTDWLRYDTGAPI